MNNFSSYNIKASSIQNSSSHLQNEYEGGKAKEEDSFHLAADSPAINRRDTQKANMNSTGFVEEKSSFSGNMDNSFLGLGVGDPSKLSQNDQYIRRRLSEDLEALGPEYCDYKNVKIQDLEVFLVNNLTDIRVLLVEFFKLRDFRVR